MTERLARADNAVMPKHLHGSSKSSAISAANTRKGQLDLIDDWLPLRTPDVVEILPSLDSIGQAAFSIPNNRSECAASPCAAIQQEVPIVLRPIATKQCDHCRQTDVQALSAACQAFSEKPRPKQVRLAGEGTTKKVAARVHSVTSPRQQKKVLRTDQHAPAQTPLFLSVQNVAVRYDVSVATIWRKVAAGQFPRPRKIAGGITRWAVADLDARDQRTG